MTTIDRTNATDTEFAERIAAFETATVPPEVLQHQVARAIQEAEQNSGADGDWYLRMADAALAVVAQQPHPAVQRVEAALSELETYRSELFDDGDDIAGFRGLGVGEAIDDVRIALTGGPR